LKKSAFVQLPFSTSTLLTLTQRHLQELGNVGSETKQGLKFRLYLKKMSNIVLTMNVDGILQQREAQNVFICMNFKRSSRAAKWRKPGLIRISKNNLYNVAVTADKQIFILLIEHESNEILESRKKGMMALNHEIRTITSPHVGALLRCGPWYSRCFCLIYNGKRFCRKGATGSFPSFSSIWHHSELEILLRNVRHNLLHQTSQLADFWFKPEAFLAQVVVFILKLPKFLLLQLGRLLPLGPAATACQVVEVAAATVSGLSRVAQRREVRSSCRRSTTRTPETNKDGNYLITVWKTF
jgi:hypothetical protein